VEGLAESILIQDFNLRRNLSIRLGIKALGSWELNFVNNGQNTHLYLVYEANV